MIERKLVLVLGAGASMPFGFPSGYGLMREIVDQLKPHGTQGSRILGQPMLSALVSAGFDRDFIEAFRSALEKSGKRSVDAFLEHRNQFIDVGKTAIAFALIPKEREELLFSPKGLNWYEYFFNRLNARFEDFDKNSISILTFNYERSLEYYLFTALKNAYGKTSEECASKMRSIPILHLYGKLGGLPGLEEEGLSFGAAPNPDNLKKGAAGIQIIHEDLSRNPVFQQAHELLQDAERICFLGFGYDFTNLERLMAYNVSASQHICGTAVDLEGRECHFIQQKFRQLGFSNSISRLDNNCNDSLEFLRRECAFDWD
jgi:hypothetical protein